MFMCKSLCEHKFSVLLKICLGVELLSYLSNFELDYLLLAAESSYLIHVKVNNTKRKFLAPAHTQAASRWLFSLLDVTRKKKSGPRGLEYFAYDHLSGTSFILSGFCST